MREFLRKALTRQRDNTASKLSEPSDRLLLAVQFSIYLLLALVALEIAHLVVLGSWNSEIFAAITGLSGTLFGILLESKG